MRRHRTAHADFLIYLFTLRFFENASEQQQVDILHFGEAYSQIILRDISIGALTSDIRGCRGLLRGGH